MDRARYEDESTIFEKLKKYGNQYCNDIPWTPTFLPLILEKVKSRKDIIPEILKLRKSTEVADYREWLGRVYTEYRDNGRISKKTNKQLTSIEKSIKYNLGVLSSAPDIKTKTTLFDIIGANLKSPFGIDLTSSIDRLHGWFLEQRPGSGYRALLRRAVVSDNQYKKINRRIKTIFEG